MEERKALRARAVEEVQKCGNVSKVSRDIGINRQVLHGWINECKSGNNFDERTRGRVEQKIYRAYKRQIIEIIAHNLPSDLEIDGIFWSVGSVQKLISKTLDINASAYLVRRWLLDWGYFVGRNTNLFEMSSSDSKWLSVRRFAKQSNMPCYIYWKSDVWAKGVSYNFQCVSSKRGDIRFVGKNCERFGEAIEFLNKLQGTAKRNIVVVYNEDRWVHLYGIYNLSEGVTLFRKTEGKLVDART